MENLIPKAVGPYSAYRMVGDYLYVSGQIGLDPAVNKLKLRLLIN